MMRFAVLSDGSCDLGPELAAEKNVHVVPFWVTFDGTNYQKEIEELPVRDFYQMMVDDPHTIPKTAQPAIQDMVEAFLPYAKEILAHKHEFVAPLAERRIDYFDVMADLFKERFMDPIRKWDAQNGLLSSGHLNGEDIPEYAARYGYGALLRALRAMDVPSR